MLMVRFKNGSPRTNDTNEFPSQTLADVVGYGEVSADLIPPDVGYWDAPAEEVAASPIDQERAMVQKLLSGSSALLIEREQLLLGPATRGGDWLRTRERSAAVVGLRPRLPEIIRTTARRRPS